MKEMVSGQGPPPGSLPIRTVLQAVNQRLPHPTSFFITLAVPCRGPMQHRGLAMLQPRQHASHLNSVGHQMESGYGRRRRPSWV